MDDETHYFRRHARDARELAREAGDERERDLFHEIAHHWEALADLWPRVKGRRQSRG